MYIAFEYILSILLTFFKSLKIVLIKMAGILMMSAKLVTLDLLKTNVLWNKGFDIRISVHDITNKKFIKWLKLYCRCDHAIKVW